MKEFHQWYFIYKSFVTIIWIEKKNRWLWSSLLLLAIVVVVVIIDRTDQLLSYGTDSPPQKYIIHTEGPNDTQQLITRLVQVLRFFCWFLWNFLMIFSSFPRTQSNCIFQWISYAPLFARRKIFYCVSQEMKNIDYFDYFVFCIFFFFHFIIFLSSLCLNVDKSKRVK